MSRLLTSLFLMVFPLAAQSNADALRPGDMLRVRIFQEPELSGEFQVDEHGVLTLPRLGDIRITTWAPDSIRPRLTRSFAEYLRDPVLEVTILRRVAIYGAVLKPGLYPVDPTMTVQEALALAGGAAPDGKRDRVELLRGDDRIETDLSLATRIDQMMLKSGDQLFVPQRSWLSRNTWLVGSLLGATATIVAVSLR
ncbi:MAG TPA: polysaccharide biosynthesis/export family protein [Gemmatimonadales bacterium]|nr:polysaccharide biosynthesis/export family protein [Gemmatimonadales bacterium]